MSERPFPDEPSAEACVVTGQPAYARIGGLDNDRVSGWYGSAVVDLECMVAVDDELPRGFVSDAFLTEAIAAGRIFDPSPLVEGDMALDDVGDRAILALLDMGMGQGVRALDRGIPADRGPCDQIPVPPMFSDGRDDPLAREIVRALFVTRRPRGTDLESVGRFWAILARARGRSTDEASRKAAATAILGKIRGNRAFLESLLADQT